jgi:translation initiation factor 2 subunit 2
MSFDTNFFITLPQVVKRGQTKTCIDNLALICREIDRDLEHLSNFIKKQLGVKGHIQRESEIFILRGPIYYSQEEIKRIIRLYVWKYVMCHHCKSPVTNLQQRKQSIAVECHCGTIRLL